jgi:hypothetical protein
MNSKRICVVAILKDEAAFLDEWLVYHKQLGINHFFLYDDDPALPLKHILTAHRDYVTTTDWHGTDRHYQGLNSQTKAYTHALEHFIKAYEWVIFLDGDEFIVLPGWNDNITCFLDDFSEATAISLNWHVFGHNGYYTDPVGLITSSLTRRMAEPSTNIKTFTRTNAIFKINSPHYCDLMFGRRLDANQQRFTKGLYAGKTDRAYINHYQCRSFERWMARVERGDACGDTTRLQDCHHWRFDQEKCLRQFVTTVAKDKNEFIDEYMLKFSPTITSCLSSLNLKNK